MLVGFGDLDVVAEDVVEAHLERSDAGPLALPRFDGGDVLLAVALDVAQRIKVGVIAGAHRAAVGQVRGRLLIDGRQDRVADAGHGIQLSAEANQRRDAELGEPLRDGRHDIERLAQSE